MHTIITPLQPYTQFATQPKPCTINPSFLFESWLIMPQSLWNIGWPKKIWGEHRYAGVQIYLSSKKRVLHSHHCKPPLLVPSLQRTPDQGKAVAHARRGRVTTDRSGPPHGPRESRIELEQNGLPNRQGGEPATSAMLLPHCSSYKLLLEIPPCAPRMPQTYSNTTQASASHHPHDPRTP